MRLTPWTEILSRLVFLEEPFLRSVQFIFRSTQRHCYTRLTCALYSNTRYTVRDPWMVTDKERIEKIQNLSVLFVCSDYTKNFSVSLRKNYLGWQSSHDQKKAPTQAFSRHISLKNWNTVRQLQNPPYILFRKDHSLKVQEILYRTNLFKMSLFRGPCRTEIT